MPFHVRYNTEVRRRRNVRQEMCIRDRYTIILSFMRGIVLTFIALILLSAFAGIYGVWLSLFSAEAITFICFYPLKRNLNRILLDKERNPNELKELDIKI